MGDDVEVGKENVFWVIVRSYVVDILHICNGERKGFFTGAA